MTQVSSPIPVTAPRNGSTLLHWQRLQLFLRKHGFFYLLISPVLLYFLIFKYVPMFGLVIAFKDVGPFSGINGILHDPFVGFKHFVNFFNSYFFWNVMQNTLVISLLKTIWGFPAPIILALLINEVRHTGFKRITQTISYLPHFLSMVIVAGLVYTTLGVQGGLVNQIVKLLGNEPRNFLGDPSVFRSILVSTTVWQTVGWGSILYLAAMTNLSPELYEAAMIDGANKWQQIWAITLPGISHVIVILFIFRIGALLDADFEQILLLYSPPVYAVSDVIDTYVYRSGLLNLKYSFATAVGLYKSVLALVLLLGTNKLAHRMGHTGIW
jgi:putative aldouronate transport system permease protein